MKMNLTEQVDAMRSTANDAEMLANDLEATLYRMRGAQIAAVDKADTPSKMPEHLLGQFHYWYTAYGHHRQRVGRCMEELNSITYMDAPAPSNALGPAAYPGSR
jgi:hypothetical protein